MYIFAINVQKFLKKKLIKTKMIFPPSSSRFALPSLTRPLRGAVPILYLAQDPHRRRAHNSVHRRTFVEHRRTQQQSTPLGAPRIALQLLRRGGAGANAVVRRGSPKAFSLRLLLCSPRMKVCYKPGFSITCMMLFNNAHLRNLAIGTIWHAP